MFLKSYISAQLQTFYGENGMQRCKSAHVLYHKKLSFCNELVSRLISRKCAEFAELENHIKAFSSRAGNKYSQEIIQIGEGC